MKISEAEQKLVDDAADKLSEHFDSVRIFVTRQEWRRRSDRKLLPWQGQHLRPASQVREWVTEQEQYVRTKADRDQRRELEE